jgi:hypothetical protein
MFSYILKKITRLLSRGIEIILMGFSPKPLYFHSNIQGENFGLKSTLGGSVYQWLKPVATKTKK